MWDFDNKIIFVSGGTRGIGAAVSELFLSAGARVIANYYQNEKAAHTFQEKNRAHHDQLFLLKCDLSEMSSVRAVLPLLDEFAKLDVLINNAGVWLPTPAETMETGVRDQTIRINLNGLMNLTQAAIPYLKKGTDSAIVNISSTAGQRGEAGYSAYAATKGAVISYTKSLAVELAPHIRVNAVAPGWVKTDMTADVMAQNEQTISQEIPMRRVAEAVDIAEPVVFLASSAARFITGEILNVNGGSVRCG